MIRKGFLKTGKTIANWLRNDDKICYYKNADTFFGNLF